MKAVGGRLLSVTNAVEARTWRQGDSGWAQVERPRGLEALESPSNASLHYPPGGGGGGGSEAKKKVGVPKIGPKFPAPLTHFIFCRRKILLVWVGESAGAVARAPNPPPRPPRPPGSLMID